MTDINPPALVAGGIAVVVEVSLPAVVGSHADTHLRTSINARAGNDKPTLSYDVVTGRKSVTSRSASSSVTAEPAGVPALHAILPPPTPLPVPIHHTEVGNVRTSSPTPPSPTLASSRPPSSAFESKNETAPVAPATPPSGHPSPSFGALVSSPSSGNTESKQQQHMFSTPPVRRQLRPSPEEELKSGPLGAHVSSPLISSQASDREGMPLLSIDTDTLVSTLVTKQHPAAAATGASTPSANTRDWEGAGTPSSIRHNDDDSDDEEEHVPLPRPSFTMGNMTMSAQLSHQSSIGNMSMSQAPTDPASHRLSFDDGTESISMGIPPTPTAKRPRFADDDDSTSVQPSNRNFRGEDDDQPNNAPAGAFYRLRAITLCTVIFEGALLGTSAFATSLRGQHDLTNQLSPTLTVFTALYGVAFIATLVECWKIFVATPFPMVPSWTWHHWAAVRSGYIALFVCGFFYPQLMIFLLHSRGDNFTELYWELDHDIRIDIAFHTAVFVAVVVCSLLTFALIYYTFRTRFYRNAHTEGWDTHGPPPVTCCYSVMTRLLVVISIGAQAAYTYSLISAAIRTLNEGTFICAAIYIISVAFPVFYGIRFFLVPAKREYFFRTLRIAHLAHIFIAVGVFWITLVLYLLDKQYRSGFFGAVNDLPNQRTILIWVQIGLFVSFIIFTAAKMYVHKFRRIGGHPHTNYTARNGSTITGRSTASGSQIRNNGQTAGAPAAIELQSLQKQSSSSNMYGGNGLASLRRSSQHLNNNNNSSESNMLATSTTPLPQSSPSNGASAAAAGLGAGVTNLSEPMLLV